MKFDQLIRSLRQRRIQSVFNGWLNRRIPQANPVHLTQHKLFIFPTAAGFGFLLLIFVMWILATNYENNLILAITFFLLSLFITAIIHSYANLSGLTVSFMGGEPVFAGDQAQIEISLSQSGTKSRQGITLNFHNSDPVEAQLTDSQEWRSLLSCRAVNRGWFRPGRVTVQSCYPLGFFKVWTHLDLGAQVLVYPAPVYEVPHSQSAGEQGEGTLSSSTGSDDFIGLKKYATGEPLQHVAWKHYARERGLNVKQYGDTVDDRLWIDWNIYPNYDRESRLSRLCGLLLDISADNVEYGLKLPSLKIPLGRGENHRKSILRELALFETEQPQQPPCSPTSKGDVT